MERSNVKIWPTSIDNSEAKEPQFLDFIVATMRESWGITLHIRVIERFQDLITNRNDHWKQQMETAHRLLSNATDGDEGFLNMDDSPESWIQLSSFLQAELNFISQCQQEVQAFFLENLTLGDTKEDVLELLGSLNTSQIAVMERMWEVEKYIPDRGEEEDSRKAA